MYRLFTAAIGFFFLTLFSSPHADAVAGGCADTGGLTLPKDIIAHYDRAVVKIDREQIGGEKDWFGTGVFYTPTRLITNAHVVGELPNTSSSFRMVYSDSDLARTRFWVVFQGRKYHALFIGRDPTVDIAILEVQNVISGICVGIFGDSRNVNVGEEVYAFGNPYGMENTVTTGIVTAKEKVHGLLSYEAYIQTQAPINTGNSGGPLVSKKDGVIIGIVNSGIRGADGMGYAIPINLFKDIEPTLKGTVRRAWIGIQFPKVGELKAAEGFYGLHSINRLTGQNAIPVLIHMKEELFEKGGVLVTDVLRALESAQIDPQQNRGTIIDINDVKTPAYKAGAQIGDIIKGFGGFSVKNSQDFMFAIFRSAPYVETTITVVRFDSNGVRNEHIFPITPIIRVPESVRSGIY